MRKKILLGIGMFVCLLSLVRIYMLNIQYPQSKETVVTTGEVLKLDSYDVKMISWEWNDSSILKKIAPDYSIMTDEDGNDYPEEKEKVAFAKLQITKTTDKDEGFDITTISLESGGWNNQWDAILYEELNGEESLYLDMKKGECKEITIPVVLFDFQFHYKDWQEVNQRKFYIVFSNYPVKRMIVT